MSEQAKQVPFDVTKFRAFVENQTEPNVTISTKYLEQVVEHINNLTLSVLAAENEVSRLANASSDMGGVELENERLRKALEFYAKPENYVWNDLDAPAVEQDEGDIAFQALYGEDDDDEPTSE